MPVNGDMPMGREPPPRASSVWWLAVVILLVAMARSQWPPGGSALPHPLISSFVPVLQIGLLRSRCVEGHHGGGQLVERRWRSAKVRSVSSSSSPTPDEKRWRLLKLLFFHGHGDGGRWPTSSSPKVNLLVEWRPNLFLLALLPNGRQFCVRTVVVASGNGSFVAPSGPVPRRRRGTSHASAVDLIAFLALCWRSFLQCLGTCVYFLLSAGSACKMFCVPK